VAGWAVAVLLGLAALWAVILLEPPRRIGPGPRATPSAIATTDPAAAKPLAAAVRVMGAVHPPTPGRAAPAG
jgi:hypothetical protein